MIYFICDPEKKSEVKIGYTNDIKRRLATLRTSSPMDLKVIATLEGDKELESEIHAELDQYRVTREWFDHDKAIDLLVEMYLGIFDVKLYSADYIVYTMSKRIKDLTSENTKLDRMLSYAVERNMAYAKEINKKVS